MNSIFITGAGAGIGRATARLFSSKGWFVGAADRDVAAVEALRDELGEDSCSAHFLDVVDAGSVQNALTEFTGRTNGMLRVLHNNAGILKVGRFEQISLEEHKRIIDINVTGLINVLHAAFPHLRDTPNAQVINMSSASAAYGTPDFASYSASKHAVRALTEALQLEWEAHGIRVGDLMPPFVNTNMVQSNEGGSPIIEKMGVNLSAEDIAAAMWAQVQSPKLHRRVSLQFQALSALSTVTPDSLTRQVFRQFRKG